MFESVRKWLINILIKPGDIGEYIANEYALHENLTKIPRRESQKTEAAKKVLLSKAIDILEVNLKGLKLDNTDDDNTEDIVEQKQWLRIYQDQIQLIKYREKQEYDKGKEIPEELAGEATQWREQIMVGEVESFIDEAVQKVKESRLENHLYNLSGQFHQLMSEKNLNLVTLQHFELKKTDHMLSLLDMVDRIQATRM